MTTILVVDDSARVRQALRLCLELHPGWKVCGEAENGRTAIEMARQTRPDVVLLDYSMPVMNGIEAAKAIREIGRSCTIVLFTMYASEQLAGLARSAGIEAVVIEECRWHARNCANYRGP